MPDTRHRSLSESLGIAGLYLFCFGSLIDQAGFYLGLLLMLIGFLMSAKRNFATLKSAPITWLPIAICMYVVAAAFLNTQSIIPDLSAAASVRSAGDFIAISGIFSVLFAWALQIDPNNFRRVLCLFLGGYLLALILGADWGNLRSYLADRPLFGLGSGFGIYTLSVLIGVFIYGYLQFTHMGSNSGRLPRLIGSLALFTLLLALFMLGQMRGSWMAGIVVLPAVVIALHRYQRLTMLSMRTLVILISVPIIFLFVVYASFDTVAARATEEWDILLAYLSQGGGELRPSSGSYRIWLWEDALVRIKERPLFGWGPNTSPLMVAESEIYGFLSHFHNLYLQIGVEIGLFGLALFAAWLYFLCRGLFHAYAQQSLNFPTLLLIIALMAIFAIVSLVQYRPSEAGQFFMIFVGGLALSYQLRFDQGAPRSATSQTHCDR